MSAVVGLGVGVMIGLFVPFGIALVLTVGFIIVAMFLRMYATVALMALLGMIGVTVIKVYVYSEAISLGI